MRTPVQGYADEATKARLDFLSRTTGQPAEDLVSEAVAQYAEYEAWKLEQIRQGIADLDAGNVVSDEEMETYFRSWIDGDGRP